MEIRQKIKSWSASHEGKWRHVPTKLEEKIPVHCEVKTRIMHTQRLMYVVGGEIRSKGFIFRIIECQQKKKGNNNGIREDGGVCSPISMTRSNQFLEEWGGGRLCQLRAGQAMAPCELAQLRAGGVGPGRCGARRSAPRCGARSWAALPPAVRVREARVKYAHSRASNDGGGRWETRGGEGDGAHAENGDAFVC